MTPRSDSTSATSEATTAPLLQVEGGRDVLLEHVITTVGRGPGVDIPLDDPTVSWLHAELVRRGPYVYVADLGLSTNGTFLNGRPVGRAVVGAGDVIAFGAVRARIEGVPDLSQPGVSAQPVERRELARLITHREQEVLDALCGTATSRDAFVGPASARDIARKLYVSEAAIKQHLLRLYRKFSIPEGPDRRTRLANEAIAIGLITRPGATEG